MNDDKRLPGVMRGAPPCKDCEERHTACHDNCTKYKAWKAEAEKIKDAQKAYAEEQFNACKEQNRRNRWQRKTF